MFIRQTNREQRQFSRQFIVMAVVLSSTLTIAQDRAVQGPTPYKKALLRYRLCRARETALKQENERVLFPLLSASRKLAADWNAVPDAEKLAFVEKCEKQLGISKVETLPDGLSIDRIPFAVPRRESLGIAISHVFRRI